MMLCSLSTMKYEVHEMTAYLAFMTVANLFVRRLAHKDRMRWDSSEPITSWRGHVVTVDERSTSPHGRACCTNVIPCVQALSASSVWKIVSIVSINKNFSVFPNRTLTHCNSLFVWWWTNVCLLIKTMSTNTLKSSHN